MKNNLSVYIQYMCTCVCVYTYVSIKFYFGDVMQEIVEVSRKVSTGRKKTYLGTACISLCACILFIMILTTYKRQK